jgi:hypothetical protein
VSRRKLWALLAAVAIFFGVVGAAAALAPYLFGLLYKCVPPAGSCGDSVGWAMIISAPISIPLTLLIAGALATMAYLRVMRSQFSN